MEEPLNVTARIVPLLSLCIKLVASALDETATTNRGVADQLKALQGDLEGVEKQVLLVQTNLGVLNTSGRDQRTWKSPQGTNGQQAIKKLGGALGETFKALQRLTVSNPVAQEGTQSTLTLSTLGDDTITLRSWRVDIKTCRENLENSWLHFIKIYDVDCNRRVDSLRGPTTIFTLRGALVAWLKRRRPGRPRNTPETKGNDETPVPGIPSAVGKSPVSSEPPTSWLLQLPTELKLYVLEILDSICRDELPNEPNPLLALRLTCKPLAFICAPMVFRTIRFEGVDPERARRRAHLSQTLGIFVYNLTLTIANDPVQSSTLQVSEVVRNMPNIRSLTLKYEREDIQPHSLIHDAVCNLEHLDQITLQETGFDPRFVGIPAIGVAMSQTFFHRFLTTVLKVHSGHLRTLQLNTLLPLDPNLYRTIRDDMPLLQHVSFTTSINRDLRDLFADSTPWASGKTGSLEALTIYKCDGADTGNFVRNVLRGTYGTRLKDVKFISSGSNIPDTLPATTPVLASIERLHFDYIAAWEVSALSLIPIQDISLTRLSFDAFVELSIRLADGLSGSGNTQPGFEGLKRLRLNPRLSSADAWEEFPDEVNYAYARLKEVCSQRDIRLCFDAEVLRGACMGLHVWL